MALKRLNYGPIKDKVEAMLRPLERVARPSKKAKLVIRQLHRILKNIETACPQQMAETIETEAPPAR